MLKQILNSTGNGLINLSEKIDQLANPTQKDFALVMAKKETNKGIDQCRGIVHVEQRAIDKAAFKAKMTKVGKSIHKVTGFVFVNIGKGAGMIAKGVKVATSTPVHDLEAGFKEAYSE